MTALERVDGYGSNAATIAVLRDQIAPGAADDELAYFAAVCARLELSPFADQIVLIGRWDSRVGRKVYRHQITVAGRRTLAARTGKLVGIEGPVWCGPRDERGELVWADVWDDDREPPYCARCLVHVDGWVTPANGTAKWSEFAQLNRDGTVSPMWQQMPSHMLGKVAESMALRRAFPDVIRPDLIGGANGPELADDLAELAEATARNAVDSEDGPGAGAATTPPVAAGTAPGSLSQSDAHRIVGAMHPDQQDAFLARHRIAAFELPYPETALEALAGTAPGEV